MDDVTITYPSGETRIVKHDTRLNQLLEPFEKSDDNPIVAGKVNVITARAL